jgi:hypothetical protein
MLDPTTQSQSKSKPLTPLPSKGGNGVGSDTTPITIQRKYKLEDFSQQAINRGQVEINYLLTEVNDKTFKALEQFKIAVESLANGGDVDLKALQDAIDAVHNANQKVAGPFPPGCLPTSPKLE